MIEAMWETILVGLLIDQNQKAQSFTWKISKNLGILEEMFKDDPKNLN